MTTLKICFMWKMLYIKKLLNTHICTLQVLNINGFAAFMFGRISVSLYYINSVTQTMKQSTFLMRWNYYCRFNHLLKIPTKNVNKCKKQKNRPSATNTRAANIAPKSICPKQAYCIIRSSQTQAEHTFSAGCYFYTPK